MTTVTIIGVALVAAVVTIIVTAKTLQRWREQDEGNRRLGKRVLHHDAPRYGDSSHCPACKSTKVARILMGYVRHPSEALQKDLDEGRVIRGGCCVTGDDPDYFCHHCRYRWRDEDKSVVPEPDEG